MYNLKLSNICTISNNIFTYLFYLYIFAYVISIISILRCFSLGSFRGMHDCLVPITSWIGNIFDSLRKTSKLPARVRGVDMRNLLLLLPFLQHNLLEEEVEDYNRENPFDPIVDPSTECIGIVLLFIDWYLLFRRRFPPKDEVDIQELQVLGMRYLHILLIVPR